MQTKFFAAVIFGTQVLGIGTTREEALEDSRKGWCATLPIVIECSGEVYEDVLTHGNRANLYSIEKNKLIMKS